jgi:hypothetical protein
MPYNMAQPTRDGINSASHMVQPVLFADDFKPAVGQAVSIDPASVAAGNIKVVDFNKGIFYGFIQEVLRGGYGSVVRATEGCHVQLQSGQTPKAGDALFVTNDNQAATDVGFPINGFFLGAPTVSWMPDGSQVASAEVTFGYGRSMTEVPSGSGGAVTSVNGATGAVTLAATDVGALPDTYAAPVASVNGAVGVVVLDAAAVGALPDSYVAPVTSVNTKTGAVELTQADIPARKEGGKK